MVDFSAVILSEADKTTRIPIAMVGTFHKGKQKFSITRADIATMAENFRKRGNGEVVIDYEHASDSPEVAMGGAIPAAGWIVGLDAQPDSNGIAWGDAKFNEAARKLLAAHEYKYGSPVINWGARDKTTGAQQGATLTSFALTNTPVLDKLPAIRLSEKGASKMAKTPVTCPEHPDTQMICPTCALDFDPVQAIPVNASEVIRLSDAKRDTTGIIDTTALSETCVISAELFRAIRGQQIALSEVQTALTTGRITPARRTMWTKIALSDIEQFRELTKDMQAVDLSERGIAGTGMEGNAPELSRIDADLGRRARERVAEKNCDYGTAMKMVASENQSLMRRRAELTLGL
jgi:hypothetical protein